MRYLYYLLLIFISGCFFGSTIHFEEKDATGKANLIGNPDFESGVYEREKIPTDWMVLSKKGNFVKVFWDSTTAHNGDKSIRIRGKKYNLSLISDSFPINYSSGYYCKFFAKTNTKKPVSGVCRFITFDKFGKKQNQVKHRFTIGKDWNKIEFSAAFFKIKASSARLIISLDSPNTSTVWLDDFGIYDVYSFLDK